MRSTKYRRKCLNWCQERRGIVFWKSHSKRTQFWCSPKRARRLLMGCHKLKYWSKISKSWVGLCPNRGRRLKKRKCVGSPGWSWALNWRRVKIKWLRQGEYLTPRCSRVISSLKSTSTNAPFQSCHPRRCLCNHCRISWRRSQEWLEWRRLLPSTKPPSLKSWERLNILKIRQQRPSTILRKTKRRNLKEVSSQSNTSKSSSEYWKRVVNSMR